MIIRVLRNCGMMLFIGWAAGFLFIGCETQKSLTQRRIRKVEKGLLRAVIIKGTKSEKLPLVERMAFYKVPGVSIAVMDRHREEWAKSYGFKDAKTIDPVTPDTLFQAGGLSRPFSAAVALWFIDKGRLELDGDLSARLRSGNILPAAALNAARKISLNDLLNRRSGLTARIPRGYLRTDPLPDLRRFFNGEKPADNPSVREGFQPEMIGDADADYIVVQRLLENLTGKSFPMVMKEAVLDPLDLKHSSFEIPLPAGLENEAAAGHLRDGGLVEGRWLNTPDSAAKGLWTTPREYAAFLMEITKEAMGESKKFLSPGLARTLLTPQAGGLGFGFSFEGSGDDAVFSVNGQTCGYSSAAVIFPSKGQGVVIMTNSDNGALLAEEILRAVSAAYNWTLFKSEEKPLYRLDPSITQEYVGRYEVTPEYFLDVACEDYYLLIQPTGQARTKFYVESQTVFFSVDPFVRIQFKRDDRGIVNGLVLWQQDFEETAIKVQ